MSMLRTMQTIVEMNDAKDEEWIKLRTIVEQWYTNHSQASIDVSLALWLDPSSHILRRYQVS